MIAFAWVPSSGHPALRQSQETGQVCRLNPAFDDSGKTLGPAASAPWPPRLARASDRGSSSILRSAKIPGPWAKVVAPPGAVNLAVAAIARKLTVAVWYLLKGMDGAGGNRRPAGFEGGKIITSVGQRPEATG